MAVLASSITTRDGKTIISRQFKDLSKDRITSLLAEFPSLLSENSKYQHTSIEYEGVRFIYQPLENVYVVLITNRQSNVLQDIDTLHILSQSLSALLRSVEEKEVLDNCFEIISAFDEVINLGYKENLSLNQVRAFLEMDSHEEKIQEIIERNKELEAAEERKRRAKEIQRKELARRNREDYANMIPQHSGAFDQQPQQPMYSNFEAPSAPSEYESYNPTIPSTRSAPPRGKGLRLGKKSGGSEAQQPLLVPQRHLESQFNSHQQQTPPLQQQQNYPHQQHYQQSPSQQAHHSPVPEPVSSISPAHNAPAQHAGQHVQRPAPQATTTRSPVSRPQVGKPINNGILVTINEKVSGKVNRDGTVLSSELKGDLQLRVNESSLAHGVIHLGLGKQPNTQFKTHPNVDKNLFNAESKIGLKDPKKSFPANDQSLGVLRWRSVGSGLLPLNVSSWINSNDDGTVSVTIEYEVNEKLAFNEYSIDDAELVIPLAGLSFSIDNPENVSVDNKAGSTSVFLTRLNEHPSGSFEFEVSNVDEENIFPIHVKIDLQNNFDNLSDVKVTSINSLDLETLNEELPYDLYYNLATESFTIE
ncbi:BA75_01518T0 [Komagataella pastoris]|uniref:Coatomer subunit delta n=1 Tax=Komagataella pastoris TaxID=4922 RepID=A0A1B2J7B9_PICPA|nr:BA75_01518T0 [Komagataella pastoris]